MKRSVPNTDFFNRELRGVLRDTLAIQSIQQLKKAMIDIICQSIDYTRHKESDLSPLIKRTVKIVKERYAETFNLKTLAAEFNVHPFFLGHQFKKELGCVFTDYINDIRIEKAKEILSGSVLSIADVAQSVGYSSHNYFQQIFKKREGMTPSDYRAMLTGRGGKE